MDNPRIFVRLDDFEEFIEVKPGLFSNKKLLEEFPCNKHHMWPYDAFINNKFRLKTTTEVSILKISDKEVIYYFPASITDRNIVVKEEIENNVHFVEVSFE